MSNILSTSHVNAAMREALPGARRTTLFSSFVMKPVLEKLFEPVNTT